MHRFGALLVFAAVCGLAPLAAQSCKNGVCVEQRRREHGADVLVRNERVETISVRFMLMLENAQVDREEPISVVLESGEQRKAFSVERRAPDMPWRFRFRTRWRVERHEERTVSADSLVYLYRRTLPDQVIYEAETRVPVPVAVALSFSEGSDVTLTDPSDSTRRRDAQEVHALEPGVRVQVGTHGRGSDRPRSHSLKTVAGRMGATFSAEQPLSLPLQEALVQAVPSGGKSGFAFEAPVGTMVQAARAGQVFRIERSLTDALRSGSVQYQPIGSGETRKMRAAATGGVYVFHQDGSVGVYRGLDPEAIGVQVGDHVAQGEALGTLGAQRDWPADAFRMGVTVTRGSATDSLYAAREAAAEASPPGTPGLLRVRFYTVTPTLEEESVAPAFATRERGAALLERGRSYTSPAR